MSTLGKNLSFSPFAPTKVLCHLERLSSGLALGPITVSIDIANSCNHHCLWCHSSKYQTEQSGCMDPDFFRKLVDSLINLKTKALSLTGGGEPTCHPFLNEILEYALDAGLEVALITNGGLLDKVRIDLLHRLRYLRISLDAGSEATHTRLHQPTSSDCGWNKIMKNLTDICEHKPQELMVGIGYLVHDLNLSEIPTLTRMLRDLNVDYFQLRPIKYHNEQVNTEVITKAYRVAKRLETSRFHVFEVANKYQTEAYSTEKCYLLPLICNISPLGEVYPCCELKGRSEYSYGNLQEKPFEEIWFSKERYDIMNRILPKNCPKCKYSLMNVLVEKLLQQDLLHINFL